MPLHALRGTCAHLSYDNAVQLLEEALMESDQHVAKVAFLVEIQAVGSCCTLVLGCFRYPEPDTAVIEATWVMSLKSRQNLVASGVWKHEVSGWRWSPWILGLMKSWNWLAYYKSLQQHTAAVNVLEF